jgi:hypothetical protein
MDNRNLVIRRNQKDAHIGRPKDGYEIEWVLVEVVVVVVLVLILVLLLLVVVVAAAGGGKVAATEMLQATLPRNWKRPECGAGSMEEDTGPLEHS